MKPVCICLFVCLLLLLLFLFGLTRAVHNYMQHNLHKLQSAEDVCQVNYERENIDSDLDCSSTRLLHVATCLFSPYSVHLQGLDKPPIG